MRIKGAISTTEFLQIAQGATSTNSNKFGAVAVREGHDNFDSKHEAGVVERLRQLERQGYIANLKDDKRALRFPLLVNDVHICTYEADARFDVVREFYLSGLDGQYLCRVGTHQVMDAKSAPTRKTAAYRYKRNLMFALFGIRILEL